MTFLFFLFSLVVGWGSFNLFYPITRHPGGSVVSFLAGWLVGELALHHLAFQVFIVLLFVWGGAVEGLLGGVGFLICITAWLALGFFYLTGELARGEVENALTSGLGPAYRGTVSPELRERFASKPDYHRIALPFAALDPEVEVIKNVAFGSHDQKLDVYRSRRRGEHRPVLMQIHGGAWTERMGSKNEQAIPLMAHMAKRDWVCVSVDYRLSPRATFPEHLIDCKEGLKWIRECVAGYGGDPDFVVVTGGSAGGHLAALMALTANDREYQPGFEDVDTTVAGAVPFYGVYDFARTLANVRRRPDFIEQNIMKMSRDENEEAFRRASPLYQAHENAPPFFVIHGEKDSLVPVEQARDFVATLREVSTRPVVYAEIPGAQHAFDMFASIRSEHTKHGVSRFLAWCYSRYLERQESK